MPSRIIKESIRGSEDLASISADAERLFWRLVVSVDDFGRFDARPKTIIGQCLTAFLGTITADQVNKWLAELESIGIVQLYTVEDKPYLVLTKWDKHQRKRAKDSKFPSPDDSCGHPLTIDNNGGQARTFAAYNVNEFVNENVNESGSGNGNESARTTEDMLPPEKDVQNLDEYCQEIEYQLIAVGAKSSYTATDADYRTIKEFYDSGVPIEFVKRIIVEVDEREKRKGRKGPKTFTYCAEPLKEAWAKELTKREPPKPIDFSVVPIGGREPPKDAPYPTPRGLPPEAEATKRVLLSRLKQS